VARVGDEVGAHPLDHHLLGLLPQRHEHAAAAALLAELDRLDPRAEPLRAVERRREGDVAGRAGLERPAHRRQHARVAQHPGQRHPARPGSTPKLRRAAAFARTTPSPASTTRIGSGTASITEASICCCAAMRRPWRRTRRASSTTGRASRSDTCPLRGGRVGPGLLLVGQPLDPGGDRLELPQPRGGEVGRDREGREPAERQVVRPDQAGGEERPEPGQRRQAPQAALARERRAPDPPGDEEVPQRQPARSPGYGRRPGRPGASPGRRR
jgi:hypothetical protein